MNLDSPISVVKGDTLLGISKEHGVSINNLLVFNSLTSTDLSGINKLYLSKPFNYTIFAASTPSNTPTETCTWENGNYGISCCADQITGAAASCFSNVSYDCCDSFLEHNNSLCLPIPCCSDPEAKNFDQIARCTSSSCPDACEYDDTPTDTDTYSDTPSDTDTETDSDTETPTDTETETESQTDTETETPETPTDTCTHFCPGTLTIGNSTFSHCGGGCEPIPHCMYTDACRKLQRSK